ncbi:hypothetical protein H109_04859 [Trichophyton interdigitale MR816]|uniref:Uncharacterized protein n=1 Tax=Trichophyton interdigitale (strain MR816) TaxID=1215338 RepID=A0A059J5W8_TRIIM|nr:hypothetical protein H109_04859 [Trichophyton interdigitale MR816]
MSQEIFAFFLCALLFTPGKLPPDISPLGPFGHIRFPRISADVKSPDPPESDTSILSATSSCASPGAVIRHDEAKPTVHEMAEGPHNPQSLLALVSLPTILH